ncbi:MAG: hypothetical protein JWP15_3314, partial [Alphaproteobacteria bacterium]|nr:hypothetical protein [Alphaproteobacteria bacterium]
MLGGRASPSGVQRQAPGGGGILGELIGAAESFLGR